MSETVKLSDGREIKVDLLKMTLEEYRLVVSRKKASDEEDQILCKVFGMTVGEYRKLPYPDWKLLITAFFTEVKNPLTAPNSASESTST